jgi:hypothetical protein
MHAYSISGGVEMGLGTARNASWLTDPCVEAVGSRRLPFGPLQSWLATPIRVFLF